MSDYGRFKLGGVEFPVSDSPFVASRTALDPILSAALDFYKAMLEKHLGDYFDAMVTDANLTDANGGTYVGKIVAEMIGYDPIPYLQASQYKFPLLALYRTEEDVEDHTVAWYKTTQKWTLLYVLPTLSAAQANKIVHILKGVRAVIVDRTIQGYDPDYLSGAEVWADCGVMEIGVSKARYGAIPDLSTNLQFPALELTIECIEREQKNPGLDNLEGIDANIDVSNGEPSEDVTTAQISWENVTP